MMQLNEVSFDDVVPIDGYGPGFFRVGGQVFDGAVLIQSTSVSGWGGFDDVAPLLALAGKVDVLFIGTGSDITPIPTALRQQLEQAGLGVESMASPPAARTYNVLLSEGRRIAAALLPTA